MRICSFKSIVFALGIASTLLSWGNAFAANLCEGSTNHSIASASSGYDAGSRYVPSRAIDNNYSNWSRWSAKGSGESIILDLGQTQNIDQVRTAWYKGDERASFFDVETSTNGSNWQRVLTDAQASGTRNLVTFDVQSSNARYVKIIGQGNSDSAWNSVIEAKVIGCPDDSAPPLSCNRYDNLRIARAFTADSFDGSYTPSRAIDNSLSTSSRWSSKGVGQSMTVDLGDLSTVRRISTAWFKGDTRQAYFDVQTSVNNSNWTTVLSSATAQGTLGKINFDVTDSNARYIKIIGKGNSSSSWNSLVELDVYGCGETDTNTPTLPPPVTPPTGNDSIQVIQRLFDLEAGPNNLNPVRNNEMVFDALAARHVTPNGNGWRHEYKMAKDNRRAMSDTSEDFSARITPVLSNGAKTIVAQYHGGDTGTLVKIYVSDTNESRHDDSTANNGLFDVYGRLRTDDSESETIVNFGTIRSGQSFDLVLTNRRGLVYVSAMGVEETLLVSDSDGAYLKFGNYLQAQDAESGVDIDDDDDWANFYRNAGINTARVTFSNINYVRY